MDTNTPSQPTHDQYAAAGSVAIGYLDQLAAMYDSEGAPGYRVLTHAELVTHIRMLHELVLDEASK